jgi:uncharacterized protein YgbK (DUF1537 family)
MKRFFVFAVAIVVAVLVGSCAKTPEEQIQQAGAEAQNKKEQLRFLRMRLLSFFS